MELKAVVSLKGKIFDGTAPEVIRKALLSAMYEATAFGEKKVKEKTPYRTGHLRSTIHGEVVEMGTPVKGIVGHQCKYGDPVEVGTGIYGPRGQMITIVPKNKKALWWPGVGHPVRKVTQKGFRGRFMFKRTFIEDWEKLREIFDRAGFTIARELEK
jgi:hypothetical protein